MISRRAVGAAPTAEATTTPRSAAPELRIHAFRVGFVGALGVLVALFLGVIIGQLSTVILYVALALFLALGLDPVVSWLRRRGMPRWTAIPPSSSLPVIGVFVALIAVIVPIVVEQVANTINDLAGDRRGLQEQRLRRLGSDDSAARPGSRTPPPRSGRWLSNPNNIGALTGESFCGRCGHSGRHHRRHDCADPHAVLRHLARRDEAVRRPVRASQLARRIHRCRPGHHRSSRPVRDRPADARCRERRAESDFLDHHRRTAYRSCWPSSRSSARLFRSSGRLPVRSSFRSSASPRLQQLAPRQRSTT